MNHLLISLYDWMLALAGATLSGFVKLQNKREIFRQFQKCKSAHHDKMQTSVDIFLAAVRKSHQEMGAVIKPQGQVELQLQLPVGHIIFKIEGSGRKGQYIVSLFGSQSFMAT